MTDQQDFFVSCTKGIEDLLFNELKSLGISQLESSFSGVNFKGDLKAAYKACLWSRLASRVLMPLSEFEAGSEDALYKNVQSINWDEHLDIDNTFAVNCHLSHSKINNSQYAALKVKDAIVDQFSEKYKQRPSVDKELPDIRINLFINKDHAILSLDLSGDPLNKRGYRKSNVPAPMKENLAAAVLLRSGWPNENKTLVDLMCGSGTLLIEAAFMAFNIAPGLRRKYWGFVNWKGHDASVWQQLKQDAQKERDINLNNISVFIKGFDQSIEAVRAANHNIQNAGLEKHVLVDQREVESCESPEFEKPGLVIVNAPYGERLGEKKELTYLYADLGDCWKRYFGGWNAALFTGNLDLAKHIGLRSHKSNTFFNGPIKCKLFQYDIRGVKQAYDDSVQKAKDDESRSMFVNRLRKNYKHLKKWAARSHITCYRVYDADLPEFSAAIDIYNDWVHIQEYQAPASVDIRKARLRLKQIIDSVPEVIDVEKTKLVVKTRQKQKGQDQYEKQSNKKYEFIVEENNLKILVNLHDYLDTGLFLDHRNIREKIGGWSKGKDFLNLFAYTGSVSVYAAMGGAKSVTTVDMSNTYLDWAKQNFKINNLNNNNYSFIKTDCVKWLKEAKTSKNHYDLIFLDPPTFSNSKSMDNVFDVQKDHVDLIHAAMKLLREDGMLIFSNNFRKFKLDKQLQKEYAIEDITQQSIPEDFKRNQKIHHCWIIRKTAK